MVGKFYELHQSKVGPMTVIELSRLHSVAATAEIRGKPHLMSSYRAYRGYER